MPVITMATDLPHKMKGNTSQSSLKPSNQMASKTRKKMPEVYEEQ